MTKLKRITSCIRVRRAVVEHGTMNMNGGGTTIASKSVETGRCGVPLFTDAERASGVCRSCADGWADRENYPIDTHATIVTRRNDRRLGGKPGERHNLCGAEPTAYDVAAPDAKRDPRWVSCAACRELLLKGGR